MPSSSSPGFVYTTRCGGNFGGNSQLTEHIIDRVTQRTLCGRNASIKPMRGWTARFDGMAINLDDDSGGVCRRCVKSAAKFGITGVFQPDTK